MAAFKLNIGWLRGTPEIAKIHQAMGDFGCPNDEPDGLIDVGIKTDSTAVWGTWVTATQAVIKKLNRKDRMVEDKEVDKDLVYPFMIRQVEPGIAVVETFAGSIKTLERLNDFLAARLAVTCEQQMLPIDLISFYNKVKAEQPKASLKSAKVSTYAANSKVAGPYSPKFLNSEEGIAFIEEVADEALVKSIQIVYPGPSGKVSISVSPDGGISFSCKQDDAATVRSDIRRLAGVPYGQ